MGTIDDCPGFALIYSDGWGNKKSNRTKIAFLLWTYSGEAATKKPAQGAMILLVSSTTRYRTAP
jgi:hypothetical protein